MVIFYVVMAAIEVPYLRPMIDDVRMAAMSGREVVPQMPSLAMMAIMAVVSSIVWVIMLALNAGVYSCLRADKERLSSASVEKIFE